MKSVKITKPINRKIIATAETIDEEVDEIDDKIAFAENADLN